VDLNWPRSSGVTNTPFSDKPPLRNVAEPNPDPETLETLGGSRIQNYFSGSGLRSFVGEEFLTIFRKHFKCEEKKMKYKKYHCMCDYDYDYEFKNVLQHK
jgi:hypothetical protein